MAEQSYGDWIRSNPPLPTKKYKKEHMAQVTEQQTAVEWFIEKVTDSGHLWLHDKPRDMKELTQFIEHAKEMEKHQHGETWDAAIQAHDNRGHVHARSIVDFDEYFEDTFKK